ncbi:uncharacterized protein [Apostichopus japonicus]|uniref:uncharacterized protein n=1 Tax=Stichopus japonicus TaxID=307972 RepID=UPI003AB3A65B
MTVCERFRQCKHCDRLVRLRKTRDGGYSKHNCNEYYCKICHLTVTDGHKCSIQVHKHKQEPLEKEGEEGQEMGEVCAQQGSSHKEDNEQNSAPRAYIFYDFETIQESGTHVPNLCVAQVVCEGCISESFETVCNFCGDKQVIFSGANTQNKFGEWFIKKENTTFIAHNFKGFDGYFILDFLYKLGLTPNIITTGGKIMQIELSSQKIRFIDSLNFMPMPLAALPKTFGIDELRKGYFPHLFNTEANQNYVGPLPDASFYTPNAMSVKKRKEFLSWYESELQKNVPFDFQKEIVLYCISDVDILRRCCLFCREFFMAITEKDLRGVDPFKHCMTIASACNLVFRRNFLKPANTIAAFHHQKQKQNSYVSLQWLRYESVRRNIYIQHAQNEGERKMGPYWVDGFATEGTLFLNFKGVGGTDVRRAMTRTRYIRIIKLQWGSSTIGL